MSFLFQGGEKMRYKALSFAHDLKVEFVKNF